MFRNFASLFRFAPLMAGARFGDRLLACLGATLGIGLTAWTGAMLGLSLRDLPMIVAPMGASAVLLFAVPASPLAQPWPAIGGNVISAAIGVFIARSIADPMVAAAIAVGTAILVMSLLRCLHPPGGAAALTSVIGGPGIAAAGYGFPFVLVAVNTLVLVVAAWAFHRLRRHPYPHRVAAAPPPGALLTHADVEHAVAEMGETFDIAPEDLDALLTRAAAHAAARR